MKKFLLNNTGLLYITTLFILFGINSCKKDKKTSGQSQALPIEVAYPVVQDVELKENYPGYLQAIQTANIVAQVSGTLQKVLYTPGDYVSEGTLLFVIDPTIYNDKVDRKSVV